MSRKYITEQIVENFIFPNRDQPEYGMEIVHNINNNSVSGEVLSFSATTISSSSLTFDLDYRWTKNSAEPFIRNSNELSILSVHMSLPSSLDYKPWIVVDDVSIGSINVGTYVGGSTFTVVPSQFGIASFENGLYYFEVRFIGHRAIYPVCISYQIGEEPTPTPTETPFGPTVEPTPTPTGPTPEPTITPTPAIECLIYTVSTTSGSGQSYSYIACDGTPSGGVIGGASGYDADTFCAQVDTVELVGAELTLTPGDSCFDGPIEATAGGSMEPCIGGTIDDYMSAGVFLDNPVTVDTEFYVSVWYKEIGNTCSFPDITTGASSQSFTVTVLAGESSGDVDACTAGTFFVDGANICGACITGTDNVIDSITFTNPGGC